MSKYNCSMFVVNCNTRPSFPITFASAIYLFFSFCVDFNGNRVPFGAFHFAFTEWISTTTTRVYTLYVHSLFPKSGSQCVWGGVICVKTYKNDREKEKKNCCHSGKHSREILSCVRKSRTYMFNGWHLLSAPVSVLELVSRELFSRISIWFTSRC